MFFELENIKIKKIYQKITSPHTHKIVTQKSDVQLEDSSTQAVFRNA
jgi:hypothetical protein